MSADETRTTSSTGGQKGVKAQRHDLIPVHPLAVLAEVYGFGASKYDDHNWRKGYEWSKSYAAAQRHLQAFWGGETLDGESGLPHLGHAMFHLCALIEWSDGPDSQRYVDHDDRFVPEVDFLTALATYTGEQRADSVVDAKSLTIRGNVHLHDGAVLSDTEVVGEVHVHGSGNVITSTAVKAPEPHLNIESRFGSFLGLDLDDRFKKALRDSVDKLSRDAAIPRHFFHPDYPFDLPMKFAPVVETRPGYNGIWGVGDTVDGTSSSSGEDVVFTRQLGGGWRLSRNEEGELDVETTWTDGDMTAWVGRDGDPFGPGAASVKIGGVRAQKRPWRGSGAWETGDQVQLTDLEGRPWLFTFDGISGWDCISAIVLAPADTAQIHKAIRGELTQVSSVSIDFADGSGHDAEYVHTLERVAELREREPRDPLIGRGKFEAGDRVVAEHFVLTREDDGTWEMIYEPGDVIHDHEWTDENISAYMRMVGGCAFHKHP